MSFRRRSSTARPGRTEIAVDGADHLVRRVANAQLCSPDRRDPRTDATDFFCSAVETGSRGLIQLLSNPALTLLLLGAILALAVYLATRTRWRPVAPLASPAGGPGARSSRRPDVCTSSGLLFLGIGVLFIPLALSISLVQTLVIGGFGLVGRHIGRVRRALALLVVALGTTLTLLGLGLVQAATACALVQIDADRPIGPIQAQGIALGKTRALGSLGLAGGAWVALVRPESRFRWRSGSPSAGPSCPGRRARGSPAVDALHRSAELVRRRWLRVASLVAVGAGLALAVGPFLGALLILVTDAPLPLLNVVAGVVYAIAMPFVALVTSYVYFDARTRLELEPVDDPDELPAEIQPPSEPPRRAAEPCRQRRSPRRAASRRHPSRRRAKTRAARRDPYTTARSLNR